MKNKKNKKTIIILILLLLNFIPFNILNVKALSNYYISINNYDMTLQQIEAGGKIYLQTNKGTNGWQEYSYAINATEGTDVTIKAESNEGYEFVEWKKGSTDGPTFSTSSEYTFEATESTALYAIFRRVQTVVFNANGGTGTMSDQKISNSVETKLNKNIFTRESYVFDKWTTKQDGTGTSYTDEENIVLNDNITLYAQWRKLPQKMSYRTHVQTYGWQDYVSDGVMSGTSGEAKRLEAIQIKIENKDYEGNILYRTHIQKRGWEQEFKKNDELSGTSGQSLRLEAIQIKLDGELANYYSVYYRVHAQSFGWLGWARNGESAGTAGYAKRLEGIEIKLVPKGTLVDGYGTTDAYKDATAPTKITLNKTTLALEEDDVYQLIATILPDNAMHKEINWISSNEQKVSVDNNGRITALEPGVSTITASTYNGKTAECVVSVLPPMLRVYYRTHVQSYGWQDYVSNGVMSGTSGEAKRLEAIQIKLRNAPYSGDIEYKTHVQSYGWEQEFKKNDELSGTEGQAKRLEAIEIRLTGEMAEHFDVYYRVHAQSFGWLSWAKNGESAGTAGYAKRLEGIEIVLVEKGEDPPVRTNQNDTRAFIENS